MLRKTHEDVEALTQSLRKALGLDQQERPDMMTVIQKTKVIFKSFGYLRVDDAKMPEAEGQWDANEGIMRLRESVFRAMQRSEPRARWTVAHELGHFALKHGGTRNRSTEVSSAERFLARVKAEEAEASRFAAAFLAPAHLIRQDDTPETIAERFGISAEAACIRHAEVRAMSERASRRERPLPSVVVDYLREARRRGFEIRTDLD
jgi:Zn-dependent peptidase ImmA (M78 family)